MRWLLAIVVVGCSVPQIVRPAEDDSATPDDDDTDLDPVTPTPVIDSGTITTDASDAGGGLQVFVTSQTLTGNMGGLAGGDAMCQLLGARLGARWAAWLSVEDGPHAVDRVTSAGPWMLPTGELVAADKASLLSGTLAHAIDRDENGQLVSNQNVWTGSGTNGKYSEKDCDRWTTGTNGRLGNTSATGSQWTRATDERCTNARRLYCFEL